jgi:hypothetical protein
MFLRRSALALSRQRIATPVVARSFTSSIMRSTLLSLGMANWQKQRKEFWLTLSPQEMPTATVTKPRNRIARDRWLLLIVCSHLWTACRWSIAIANVRVLRVEVESETDLVPPGAKPGTVPTDEEQSTGLERLEILGKMQGVDIFDMKPLDASRLGTFPRTLS